MTDILIEPENAGKPGGDVVFNGDVLRSTSMGRMRLRLDHYDGKHAVFDATGEEVE